MTLETSTFLAAGLRTTGFGAAFLALTTGFDFAAAFFGAPVLTVVLTVLRAGDLAEVALLALGLDGDFALTARFALFAAGLAFERDVDRLNPFVRLLLMAESQKAAHLKRAAAGRAQLTTHTPLNQRRQVFAGALPPENLVQSS